MTPRLGSPEQQCLPLSLQSLAECFRRLPGLLIADVGVAHRRADILVAEKLLDLPQILSQVIEEDRGRGMP